MDNNLFCLMNDSSQIFTMYESGSDYDTYLNTAAQWELYKSDYPRFELNSPRPQDPQFDIVSNDTITLLSTSPAIDAGISFDWITDDYYGNLRTGTFDIGAYEYGASPPITIPTGIKIGGMRGIKFGNHPLKF